jgi:hypothetical protein
LDTAVAVTAPASSTRPFARRIFRLCPRCDGTGRRVRIGRRIYEYLRSEHAKGSR